MDKRINPAAKSERPAGVPWASFGPAPENPVFDVTHDDHDD